MSKAKLQKFLDKTRESAVGSPKFKPCILSDSKGNYLRRHAAHPVETEIEWFCKSGSSVENSKRWLQRNIAKKIINFGNIWLYVWLGTCNLTTKNKQYISLSHSDEGEVDFIIKNLRDISTTVNKHPGSKVTFLEIPVYSIVNWNATKGHKQPDSFKEQDVTLATKIYHLNGMIRELNRENSVHSPEFSSDLSINPKHRKRGKQTTTKKYNFNLYVDGIHPSPVLCKYWLKKIAEQVRRDCWTE